MDQPEGERSEAIAGRGERRVVGTGAASFDQYEKLGFRTESVNRCFVPSDERWRRHLRDEVSLYMRRAILEVMNERLRMIARVHMAGTDICMNFCIDCLRNIWLCRVLYENY